MIDEESCPVLFDDFICLISFLVCLIVMCGRVNLHFGFLISCSRIWVWLIVLGLNLFLILIILFMKCVLAIFAIFLSEVTTLFSCIIFLGGVLVLVLVSSLTVVQSLFMLLTSGFILVSLFPLVLLFIVFPVSPLLFVPLLVLYLLFIVSFCE